MGKTDCLDTMEMQIEEWGTKIEELMREAEKMHDGNRHKIYSQIKSLRMKQEATQKRVNKLKKMNEELAEQIKIKNEVEEVLNNLSSPLEASLPGK